MTAVSFWGYLAGMQTDKEPTKGASQRILEREFNQRLTANPMYSKRAFAKCIGIAPSFLSNLINGKRRLTVDTATLLTNVLVLGQADRSALMKEAIGQETDDYATIESRTSLSSDAFEHINEWWYITILEFLETNIKNHAPEEIARHTGLPKGTVKIALNKLVEMKIIEKDPRKPKRFRKILESLNISSNTPNESLRKYHAQLFDKAKEAIYIQNPHQKVLGSMVIAFDPSDIPEIQKRWAAFRKDLESFLSQGQNRKEVCAVVFETFSLTKHG